MLIQPTNIRGRFLVFAPIRVRVLSFHDPQFPRCIEAMDELLTWMFLFCLQSQTLLWQGASGIKHATRSNAMEFNRRCVDPVGLEVATPFHVVFFLMIRVEDDPGAACMLPFHWSELGLIEAMIFFSLIRVGVDPNIETALVPMSWQWHFLFTD